MILDDGGDATLLMHLGARAEKDLSRHRQPDQRGGARAVRAIRAKLAVDPKWYSTRLAQINGVTEETTTGVKRLYQMAKEGTLPSPRSTSTTPSPRASSTTCTAAASRWSMASSAPPT